MSPVGPIVSFRGDAAIQSLSERSGHSGNRAYRTRFRSTRLVHATRVRPFVCGRDRLVDIGADRIVAHGVSPIDQALLVRVLHVREARGQRRQALRLVGRFAMWPGASVCGLYFSHPEAHYFGVGKIERDQVEDYARRKGWSVQEAERWLAPVLNYDALAVAREAAE